MPQRNARILCTLLALVPLAACGDDGPTDLEDTTDFTMQIESFVDLTVVATYADLAAQATTLNAAVQAFAEAPGQGTLDLAAQAWIDTREPWEASEGFLFGPVAFLGLDPSLDSWPLDVTQLEDVLDSSFELTPEFIREGLNASLRGFHTIEFLLFRDGAERAVADVTEREREYLVAATQVLYEDASLLHEAWTEVVDGVGPRAFGDEFRNAGRAGSRYLSQTEAMLEVVEGMIVIADEVGNGKISDPFTQQDPAIVESWFSWNSLTDFANNVRSIENAYLGGYHKDARGTGVATYVAAEDAALDTRIRAEIDAAIDAIEAIPAPFRDNLDATTEIEAAIASLNTLVGTFESDLKALLRGE